MTEYNDVFEPELSSASNDELLAELERRGFNQEDAEVIEQVQEAAQPTPVPEPDPDVRERTRVLFQSARNENDILAGLDAMSAPESVERVVDTRPRHEVAAEVEKLAKESATLDEFEAKLTAAGAADGASYRGFGR